MASGAERPTRTLSEHQAIIFEYGVSCALAGLGHYAPDMTTRPEATLHDRSELIVCGRARREVELLAW
jgi:hypothetical protein